MIYGYARVSSAGQALDGNSIEAQERILRENGAAVIYRECFTGTKKHRPELDKLMSIIQDGDTLMVAKLDRMARSTVHGCKLVEELIGRGVRVYILNMGVLDNTPTSKLMRTMFFAFAEFERDMIAERTSEGREIAKKNNPNYREGRKPIEYDIDLFDALLSDVHCGALSVIDAAEKLGVSRTKWYRIAKEKQNASPTVESKEKRPACDGLMQTISKDIIPCSM